MMEDTCDKEEEVIQDSHKRPKQFHVKDFLPKHNIQKPTVQGSGPTSAILSDVTGFRRLLKKLLAFHSFIHYFENVPVSDRTNTKKIQQYISEMINSYTSIVYRGDSTIDCNTGKIHSHLHLAHDIEMYGHPMNWECSKGERGLKTWAKIASKTAQKRNIGTFMTQTATRVSESLLFRNALEYIDSWRKDTDPNQRGTRHNSRMKTFRTSNVESGNIRITYSDTSMMD
jgi:hypothetical protein